MRQITWVGICLIAAVALVAGCQPKPAAKPAKDDHAHHDHEHALGPHGGHILELGNEEYHAEWTHDDASGKVAVYLLDKDMKKESPIAAEKIAIVTKVKDTDKTYDLEAVNRTTGEKPVASQFETTDKQLVEILTTVGSGVSARLEVVVDGKPFSAKFEAHEDHGHKH